MWQMDYPVYEIASKTEAIVHMDAGAHFRVIAKFKGPHTNLQKFLKVTYYNQK